MLPGQVQPFKTLHPSLTARTESTGGVEGNDQRQGGAQSWLASRAVRELLEVNRDRVVTPAERSSPSRGSDDDGSESESESEANETGGHPPASTRSPRQPHLPGAARSPSVLLASTLPSPPPPPVGFSGIYPPPACDDANTAIPHSRVGTPPERAAPAALPPTPPPPVGFSGIYPPTAADDAVTPPAPQLSPPPMLPAHLPSPYSTSPYCAFPYYASIYEGTTAYLPQHSASPYMPYASPQPMAMLPSESRSKGPLGADESEVAARGVSAPSAVVERDAQQTSQSPVPEAWSHVAPLSSSEALLAAALDVADDRMAGTEMAEGEGQVKVELGAGEGTRAVDASH